MRRLPTAVGAGMVAMLFIAYLLLPQDWRENLSQGAFDVVFVADQHLRRPMQSRSTRRVVVVEIDDRSLEALGPWPWPRETIASLIGAIAAAKPAVIAVDILFAEPDSRSPAALARQLGALTARPEIATLAATLTDGDTMLAKAALDVPMVLGFVLDPERHETMPQVPIILRGAPTLDGLWGAPGAVGPTALLRESASSVAALSLPANSDGIVRHVPLLVVVGGTVLPGLAVEAARLTRGASAYLLESDPTILVTGDLRIPIARDGLLRLLPVRAREHAARTLSAVDLVQHSSYPAPLAGAVVLVGGSAPALGGLRPTPSDALTPSVQIQGDAVQQIFSGRFPRPVVGIANPVLSVLLGAIATLAVARLAPLLGALVTLAAILLTWGGAIGSSLLADRLVDPVTPTISTAAVFIVASITSFAVTYRRDALIRRRFEQRLAPAIVKRIIEKPSLIKLTGERREVTALITDLEGLTSMTHRADPQELVAMLDAYFEGLGAIIVQHGGMIDKIVGDAVHALFNAPVDLDDYPRRSVECALAIRAWSEAYRATPAPAALGLGRTRIGIETGEAIVGDVGIESKLDYTAYGDAVNAAARFEQANKWLGSAICVGPATAARIDPAMLRPLGAISVRGRDEVLEVFEPWPMDAPLQWRERYMAAFNLVDADRTRAAEQFLALAAEREGDPVPRLLAERIVGAGAPRNTD
jgi:adenylate cyclase